MTILSKAVATLSARLNFAGPAPPSLTGIVILTSPGIFTFNEAIKTHRIVGGGFVVIVEITNVVLEGRLDEAIADSDVHVGHGRLDFFP